MKTLTEFTANDTIVGDLAAYAAFTADLEASLHPWGMLEVIFAAEIVRATWRLQHVTIDETLVDEYLVARLAKTRSGSQATIRWATTELRRLQTARRLRDEMELPENIGLADPREVMKFRRGAAKSEAAQQPDVQTNRSQPRPTPPKQFRPSKPKSWRCWTTKQQRRCSV